jgi:hypothetical protein
MQCLNRLWDDQLKAGACFTANYAGTSVTFLPLSGSQTASSFTAHTREPLVAPAEILSHSFSAFQGSIICELFAKLPAPAGSQGALFQRPMV